MCIVLISRSFVWNAHSLALSIAPFLIWFIVDQVSKFFNCVSVHLAPQDFSTADDASALRMQRKMTFEYSPKLSNINTFHYSRTTESLYRSQLLKSWSLLLLSPKHWPDWGPLKAWLTVPEKNNVCLSSDLARLTNCWFCCLVSAIIYMPDLADTIHCLRVLFEWLCLHYVSLVAIFLKCNLHTTCHCVNEASCACWHGKMYQDFALRFRCCDAVFRKFFLTWKHCCF